jgi:hypothetical protein
MDKFEELIVKPELVNKEIACPLSKFGYDHLTMMEILILGTIS